jgi:hypothetical protein
VPVQGYTLPYLFFYFTDNTNYHISLGVSHEDLPTVLKALYLAVLHRHKKLSQQRMLAFTKRLATLAMQLLHNGAISCLAVIRAILQVRVLKFGPKNIFALWLREINIQFFTSVLHNPHVSWH